MVDLAVVMCEAIPRAARHGWRQDEKCASAANTTVHLFGYEHHVCKIHEAVLNRVVAQEGADGLEALALSWGWRTNGKDHA